MFLLQKPALISNPVLAAEYNIKIVPMHVSFDHETMEDGAFPVEKIVDYYEETGKLPKTSGSTPGDFETAFDRIHAEYPDAQLLYLAYSAVTTCYHAECGSGGRGTGLCHDSGYEAGFRRAVQCGDCGGGVFAAAPRLDDGRSSQRGGGFDCKGEMCFMPENLEFLRAGGRVSNVAFLGAKLLNLHPVIEILDGKLVATKKYRGKMKKVAVQMLTEYAEKYNLERDCLWFVWVVGFPDAVRQAVEEAAKALGFKKTRWIQAGGVITTHGGPAAFGLAGFTRK